MFFGRPTHPARIFIPHWSWHLPPQHTTSKAPNESPHETRLLRVDVPMDPSPFMGKTKVERCWNMLEPRFLPWNLGCIMMYIHHIYNNCSSFHTDCYSWFMCIDSTKSAWSRHAVYEMKLYTENYRPQLFEVIWQKNSQFGTVSLTLSLSLNCLALGG